MAKKEKKTLHSVSEKQLRPRFLEDPFNRLPENLTSGYKIKALRLKANMSQTDIGDRLGISTPAVSKIESNRTVLSITRIKQIADIFSVPLVCILPGEDPEHFTTMGLKEYQTQILSLEAEIADKDAKIMELQRKLINLYEIAAGK